MKPYLILCILLLGIGGMFTRVVATSANNPPQHAESLRQALFNAQVSLLNGDRSAAEDATRTAQQLYQQQLQPIAQSITPDLDSRVSVALGQAVLQAQTGETLALAANRGQITIDLLNISAEVVYAAIERGDLETALLWLPLRDFRVSTRFSRPSTQATRALEQLQTGRLDPAQALSLVRSDLMDTYQAQLTLSLQRADEAAERGFSLRQAEESGRAAAYFEILAPAYGDQYGTTALSARQADFTALVTAAIGGDQTAFSATYTQLQTTLIGFRAVPLSEEEAARRAGQLVRFLALVPIEYERGVRHGVVINDIEIQEAFTFQAGANAAFNDLQSRLIALDPVKTDQIRSLLAEIRLKIETTADPNHLRADVDQAQQLIAGLLPPEWLQGNAGSDLDVILSVLDQVEVAVVQGEYALAESARLEAYALLELGLEQRLRGFAPELAIQIESLFWQGTAERPGLAVLLANRAALSEVRQTLNQLKIAFDEAELILGGASAPEAVIGNASVIVFREGLEAVLILASLLASLRSAEEKRYRDRLILGAGLAFIATALTWVIAHRLLVFLLPLGERLEAIVSLIAIAVLLVIMNWFFHKVYWTGWLANFHTRKRQLLGGRVTITLSQTFGLVLLGFTSIYREGFETVLFLQSLVLEAGIMVVLQGVALGLLGTAAVGFITFKLQMRLPYKKMLIVTGVMICLVLLTMIGHTVHVMQVIGWLPITPIQGVFIPYWMGQWFGLFATWQGILLQIVALIVVIGSYFLAEYQTKQHRQPTRQSVAS
ncbi:MAG: FTR1 family protein [Anaerolineae bacterium]|nr:FTR1 family protein [Anaerolineae bacterium]